MDEFELIRRYFVRPGPAAGVVVGIGDDGAVLSPTPGRLLVNVVDTMVEGVHWPAALPPADVGFRAVAVNVSDIAAMGGQPRWMTLALTLPGADDAWLTEFARGLFEAAEHYETALVGGDVTRGRDTVISVQVTGEVEPEKVLERAAARPGQGIYVTGSPGEAAGGLELLRDMAHGADEADRRRLIVRFARPDVRLGFARDIAGVAAAAIDVSDGLFADAAKLLAASGAGGRLELERLPRSGALARVFGGEQAARLVLTGGDDYELCFTADPAKEAAVLAAGERHGVKVTRIGRVTREPGLVVTRDGREVEFSDPGYRHF